MGVAEEGKDGGGEDIVKDVRNLLPGVKVEFTVLGRIGRKGGGPRPVHIMIKENAHRRKLFANAREIKTMVGLNKVYLVPDLTRLQQMEDKKLRDQVKELR